MTTLLLLGAAFLVVGSGVAALSRNLRPGLAMQATGTVLLSAVGSWALVTDGAVGASFTSEFAPRVGVDGLSGVFLLALGLVAVPALVFATAYLRPTGTGRAIASLLGLFVLALAGVLVARDPLSFLTFWELMTLIPAAIVLVGGHEAPVRRATFVYLAITHLGSAAVWVAVLLLADANAIGGRSAIEEGSALQAAIALAAIVGFGTKAGVMPLHAWLPRAHPIAPAPASALMSGVMVKVALYGLIRVLVEWLGPIPGWIGALVIALGAISALAAIVYALLQDELKRLLAFSTIDNVGIVLLGIGACIVLRAQGDQTWAAIALAAALLHVVTHAVAKGLLFLGAGSLERAVGSLELDGLGGLLRRMPLTGTAIALGAASLAGLPPLAGFASEWATLQSLLHVPAAGGTGTGIVGAIALGALACTAALAAYCFVKLVGMVLLGPPARAASAAAQEAPRAMWLATAALGAGCVVLGLIPGLLFATLVRLEPWSADAPVSAGLTLPTTGDLPTPGFLLVLVAFTGALVLLRGSRVAPAAPTWACGQPLDHTLVWTSAGFTKSLRLVLETILRPEREVTTVVRAGVVQDVLYQGRIPHLVDERLYRPITRGALRGAETARRLQSGRLSTYVAYLAALVVVLLLAVRIGVVG